MHGIMDCKNLYRKSKSNAKDIKVVNKHLENAVEAALGDREKEKLTAHTVELGADEDIQPQIRNMLRKQYQFWAGKLEKIPAVEHPINLVQGKYRFKLAHYRAGPRTRELDEFEL